MLHALMNRFKTTFLLSAILVFCFSISSRAQEGRLINNQALAFSLPEEENTVEFIVVDTELSGKKPVFLWCQGSLPVPLFGEIEGQGLYMLGGGVQNFDYKKIQKDYRLVVISMPQTPLIADKEHLNAQFQYVPDKSQPNQFLTKYILADYLDNYVQRAEKVLDFLGRQSWVDNRRLIIAGHSQGAKVATKMARSNGRVSHLGLFSPNPFGRIDQYIRQARFDAQTGKISWEQADSIMQDNYRLIRDAYNPELMQSQPELITLGSFSETFFDDWLQLNVPIYLAYGTEDRAAELCDLMPLIFTQEYRDNLTMKRYLRLEHNFFEVDAKGKIDYEKAHWPEVMEAFLKWIR